MDQTVFPVLQGFPRPPDGGQPAPTNLKVPAIVRQAFAPAPLVNPFPIEPTPPARPTQVVLQAFAPVPVLAQITPFNPFDQDVDLMLLDDPAASGAPTYVVGDTGTIATNTQQSLRNYTVGAVADYETGGAPSATSINLLVTFTGGQTLDSYGVSLSGRTLELTGGAWIAPLLAAGISPSRVISLTGTLSLVIPNNNADGVPFPWATTGGPAPGTIATVDVARTSSDVTFLLTGQVQNVVPSTNPLLDPDGELDTLLPVQQVDVSEQQTVVGTPVDYFQTNHHP
jgi:hypothetical protein